MLPEFRHPVRPTISARVWTILLAILAAALEIVPEAVGAHAIIVAARPAMNSTVAEGDLEIRLDFSSNIDRRRSRLTLQRPDGTEAAIALTPNAPPGVLAGRTEAKMAGRWKLNWQVLSLDGHMTRGEVIFSVRDKPSAP